MGCGLAATGNVGVGFSVPSNTVKDVVAQILRTGRVDHAYLGISGQAVTRDVAEKYNLAVMQGVLVESVTSESGADDAGLKGGKTRVVVAGETFVLGGYVGVDRDGIVTPRRKDARDPIFRRLGKQSNPRALEGAKEVALAGADVFVGVSAGNSLTPEQLNLMADDAIVFAMANPTPEVLPEEIERVAAVIGTGRSDYPNQINNVLAFPGVFRGALDVRAREINREMEVAAAHAIADTIPEADVFADYIVPSVFNRAVAPSVAAAVAEAADATGAARKRYAPATRA